MAQIDGGAKQSDVARRLGAIAAQTGAKVVRMANQAALRSMRFFLGREPEATNMVRMVKSCAMRAIDS